MIKKFVLAIFLYLSLFTFTLAQTGSEVNAGFVSGLWYSKTPFFAGETVRIYTALQNQSGFDITGTIRFFDKGEIIGESEFSAINGRLIEKWIDYEITEGEHKFQVKIFDPKKSIPGGGEEAVILSTGSSQLDNQYADIDTDGDGIGNKNDSDDDADGITDKEEKDLGTDPLVNESFETNKGIEGESLAEENNSETKSKIEEGKKIAEKFVVEPVRDVTKEALAESKPVIERIGDLLENKQQTLVKKIEEDKKNSSNIAAAGAAGFYEKVREKLPPTFRILYNWLLKFLVLVFSVWWIPLLIFVLLALRIFLGLWRKVRRKY